MLLFFKKEVLSSLRSGAWLTESRLRIYSATLICFYGFIFLLAFLTAHGKLDVTGKPLGTDFSEVWLAGRSVLTGHPEAPYDPLTYTLAQKSVFGAANTVYAWHYPPYFLVAAALLALLPYVPALLVYLLGTLALYLAMMRSILPGGTAFLCALAFPATYVNFGNGQNAFLTAALIGAALLCLGRRPVLAGVLFGLVAYKPQYGVVIPVALVAGGYWRTIAAAAATVATMTIASFWLFGAGTWQAFRQSFAFTRGVLLEAGGAGWEKVQSAFAAVRMWGGGVYVAYVAQAVVSVLVIVAVFAVWRSEADWRLRGAALLAGALLTTPYCLDYDMMLLGPAIGFFVAACLQSGALAWEHSFLAAVWSAPLVARLAGQHLMLPLGWLATVLFFGLVCRRVLRGIHPLSTPIQP